MKREVGELAWRIKLTVAAAFMGAWLGFWGWVWWLAEQSGGSGGWAAREWVLWAWSLLAGPAGQFARGELLIAAAVGAALLVAPLVYLFFRKEG